MPAAAALPTPGHRPAQWAWRYISSVLPRRSFLTFHWAYFLIACGAFSLVFWLSSESRSVPYIDSLFMVVSAISLTGLNTINLSDLNTAQQVQLYTLMILSSQILVSIFVLYIRKRDFENMAFGQSGPRMNSSRQSLVSVEYKAVRLLFYLVTLYMVLCPIIGTLILAPYITLRRPNTALSNGVDPRWLGVFLSVSSFNNVGMSLLDLSMMPFRTSYTTLLTSAFLTLAGNTTFPIVLRVLLWSTLRLLPANEYFKEWRETLTFILKYPRRVYTHLFPSQHTWMLVGVLVLINGSEWIALEVLDKDNPVLEVLPSSIRWLDGFFQTTMTRTSGFAVFSISSLRIGIQALYLAMMFISAYPTIMAMRSSNVYEERSLGIHAHEFDERRRNADENNGLLTESEKQKTHSHHLQRQLQKQLGHDVWFPIAAAIFILWIETGSYDRDPQTFSVFNILFETVSAYACVGLSTGLLDQPYSLSGEFHTASKLILCLTMLRGRHRGLPVAIDRAIQLPHNSQDEREQ